MWVAVVARAATRPTAKSATATATSPTTMRLRWRTPRPSQTHRSRPQSCANGQTAGAIARSLGRMSKPITPFTVAAVHAASEFLDLDASVEKACRLIAEAGREGARLVVFPETFLPAYPFWIWSHTPAQSAPLFAQLFEQSVELPGDATRRIGQAARDARTWVCMGLNERDGGTLYNTLAWFDDQGRLVARHRKLQPTNAERTIWGRGDGRDVFVLDTDLGRLGGLICFEHSMDLNRYALIALGQQVHVAAWPAISAVTADPNSGNFDNMTETAIKYHAMAAQAYVICVQSRVDEQAIERIGLTGQEDKIRVGGGLSAIVAPNATYVAGPHRDDEAILYGEIDLGMIPYAKFFADSAGHYARPDVFSFGIDGRAQTPITGAPAGGVDRFTRHRRARRDGRGRDRGRAPAAAAGGADGLSVTVGRSPVAWRSCSTPAASPPRIGARRGRTSTPAPCFRCRSTSRAARPSRVGRRHARWARRRCCASAGSASTVRRTPRTIGLGDPGHLVVALALDGACAVCQDGRAAALQPGDLTTWDSSRPFTVPHDGPFDLLLASLPRAAVRSTAPTAARAGGPAGRAAAAFLRALWAIPAPAGASESWSRRWAPPHTACRPPARTASSRRPTGPRCCRWWCGPTSRPDSGTAACRPRRWPAPMASRCAACRACSPPTARR